jgi:hypothetical protein
MKARYLLPLVLLTANLSYGQIPESTKSRDTIALTEVKVTKLRKKKVKANAYIDVNANNLFQAIRAHMGNARLVDNKVILLADRRYAPTTGSPYAIWVVDGAIIGEELPALDFNIITKVRVLKTIVETEPYGFRGASGVIEITTARQQ